MQFKNVLSVSAVVGVIHSYDVGCDGFDSMRALGILAA